MARYSKDRLPTLLTGTAAGGIMLLIFFFSAQPAVESSQISSGLLSIIIDWVKPLIDGITGADWDFLSLENMLRKLGHFSEYAALGFMLCLHLRLTRRKLPWGYAWLAGTLYACTDELHQLFSAGRSGEVRDVLIDSSGVLTGCLTLLLLVCILRAIKKRSKRSA